jgi:hypothetical protein
VKKENWQVINALIQRQLSTITLAYLRGDLAQHGGSRIPLQPVAG